MADKRRKVSAERMAEIHAALKGRAETGLTLADIARDFDLSESYINLLARRLRKEASK